jgi:hypothetical protein
MQIYLKKGIYSFFIFILHFHPISIIKLLIFISHLIDAAFNFYFLHRPFEGRRPNLLELYFFSLRILNHQKCMGMKFFGNLANFEIFENFHIPEIFKKKP